MNNNLDFVCEMFYILKKLRQKKEMIINVQDKQTEKLISTINSQSDQICRES